MSALPLLRLNHVLAFLSGSLILGGSGVAGPLCTGEGGAGVGGNVDRGGGSDGPSGFCKPGAVAGRVIFSLTELRLFVVALEPMACPLILMDGECRRDWKRPLFPDGVGITGESEVPEKLALTSSGDEMFTFKG